jgi:antitoxin FitA
MGTKMIQIRHVPEDVHARLKARAAAAGMSLSDYLLREITFLANRLTWDEYFDLVDREEPIATGIDWVETIRAEREERERELGERTMRSFQQE